MSNQTKQYKTNLPRFFVAGILLIAIIFMWVNNKNKAEALKQQNDQKNTPKTITK